MISVFLCDGNWIAGTKIEDENGTYLDNPLAYVIQDKMHGFLPLVGNPKTITVRNYSFTYSLESGEIFDLYTNDLKRLTTVQDAVILEDPKIISNEPKIHLVK